MSGETEDGHLTSMPPSPGPQEAGSQGSQRLIVHHTCVDCRYLRLPNGLFQVMVASHPRPQSAPKGPQHSKTGWTPSLNLHTAPWHQALNVHTAPRRCELNLHTARPRHGGKPTHKNGHTESVLTTTLQASGCPWGPSTRPILCVASAFHPNICICQM